MSTEVIITNGTHHAVFEVNGSTLAPESSKEITLQSTENSFQIQSETSLPSIDVTISFSVIGPMDTITIPIPDFSQYTLTEPQNINVTIGDGNPGDPE